MIAFLHSNFWIISSIAMLIGIILALRMGIQDLRERVFKPIFPIITIIIAMLWTVCLTVIVYRNITKLLIK